MIETITDMDIKEFNETIRSKTHHVSRGRFSSNSGILDWEQSR